MRLLLDGRFAPITSEVGFIELSIERIVDGYVDWMRSIHEPQGGVILTRPLTGTLSQVFQTLLPLVSVVRSRSLFVPTRSGWVAYFDNGWRGTDAFPPVSYLAKHLGCRGMRVLAVPDTMDGASSDLRSRYGGLVWEVYGAKPNPILNIVRTLSVVNDDGWSFDQSGTPFPFEDVASYSAKRKRDRFTFEMLKDYLAHLGVHPFDYRFYLPAKATLIEVHRQRPPNSRDYSLLEARNEA